MLIRNPRDRELVRIVEESRFIASTDLYRIDGRSRQVLSQVVRQLRQAGHLPIVSSAGRLPPSFYPPKTYVYGWGKRGHIVHWLYISHLRGLFQEAARRLNLPLEWRQHSKHYQGYPDAHIAFPGASYALEVDNSTEGMQLDRIAGKVTSDTLIVAFRGEERFKNLAQLGGLSTWHGYFHDLEDSGFNILAEKCWWNGEAWVSLL